MGGIEYIETFSLVLKMTSLKKFLALATLVDYHIHQMDVTTTFLYGLFNKAFYINQPKIYVQHGNESKVFRLLKSLHSLKQFTGE